MFDMVPHGAIVSIQRSNLLLLTLFFAGISFSRSQVAPTAYAQRFTIDGGGLGSLFQPDYGGNHLIGLGAYVDVRLTRWIQPEFEGRWLRFNQFENVHQDNYLLGPRVPIHKFWKATPYAKVLVGMGSMNFQFNYAHGRFTDIAYGGGVDIDLNRHFTVRPADFEYQQWPNWVQGTLYPWGVSAGISYRVWGGRQ